MTVKVAAMTVPAKSLTTQDAVVKTVELPLRSKASVREAEGVVVYVTRSKVSPARVGFGSALQRKKQSLKGLGL